MIVSSNRRPNLEDFSTLVDNATNLLNDDAKLKPYYYLSRNAQKLEDDVLYALKKAAHNTEFQGSIKKVSGQKFPDIVAKKYYGVEVKSSKDESWSTLGGSINESTREEGVERIFLTFGKLATPIEFRSRPYEDCLSDVVVTHYPRYKVNMNLTAGETIFDKMNTTYDGLRLADNPVMEIIQYYKRQLKDGEHLWWIGVSESSEEEVSLPVKIRLWNTLSQEEKKDIVSTAFALFPDVLGNFSKKYERFTLWLAANHGIVSTSMRDSFSAGGKENVTTESDVFYNIDKIYKNLQFHKNEVIYKIMSTPEHILRETWNEPKIASNRKEQWLDIAISKKCFLKNYDARSVLTAIMR